MARLFGTDGVRGIANPELTGDLAFRPGRAAVVALTVDDDGPTATGRGLGRIRRLDVAGERYLRHLDSVPGCSLQGMRVVVDCANGAASALAPEILRRHGAKVVALSDAPDGWNINDGVGATVPEVVARAVLEHGADAGVA